MAKRKSAGRKTTKGRRVKRKPSKFSNAIQSLRRMKMGQRCNAIRFANDKFIRDIVTHVKRLRNKKVSPQVRKSLRKHSKKLRFITNPKVSIQRKRNALSQKGGILPFLLPILAPLAASVIGGIIGKR